MRIEPRQFLVSRNPLRHKKLLCLVAETPQESKLIDDYLGCVVHEDGLVTEVKGEVRLSDGYGDHYIRLEIK